MKKVWAYTIGKDLDDETLGRIETAGRAFVSEWTAHENKLSAEFEIIGKRIILVKVDEQVYNASGCSIDKLLKLIKGFETTFQVELLNRMLVPYEKNGRIEITHANEIKNRIVLKEINENTLVYVTSVSNESELMDWKQLLKNTWLSKYLV